MKKYLLFTFIIFNLNVSYSQINLEHTYAITGTSTSNIYGAVVKFSALGDKYAIIDRDSSQIKFYNLNHSLYKTINLAAPTLLSGTYINLSIMNISDNLFNSDNLIEVAYSYEQYNNTLNMNVSEVIICDENGTIVFHKDSASFDGGYYNSTLSSDDWAIMKTSSGYKMGIQYTKVNNGSIEIYSLPGQLTTVLNTPKVEPTKFMIYPNPADSYTKIDFELENGQTGDVIIYNAAGNIIKKYKVDDTFGSLLLNSSDLPEGSYLYQLSTSKGSGSKKVMVIH